MNILMIGGTEIILISALALMIFGGKKIPELMRGLGQGVKSFKDGMSGVTNPDEEPKKENETTPASENIEDEKQ